MPTEVDDRGFWKPRTPGPCWVCGEQTKTAYLDLGWQHDDCDSYPSPEGNVYIVRGEKRVEPFDGVIRVDDPCPHPKVVSIVGYHKCTRCGELV